jgi:hypothetical protein
LKLLKQALCKSGCVGLARGRMRRWAPTAHALGLRCRRGCRGAALALRSKKELADHVGERLFTFWSIFLCGAAT